MSLLLIKIVKTNFDVGLIVCIKNSLFDITEPTEHDPIRNNAVINGCIFQNVSEKINFGICSKVFSFYSHQGYLI